MKNDLWLKLLSLGFFLGIIYLSLIYFWPWFLSFVWTEGVSDIVRELVKQECLK
jgi:hypothetical protein